MGLDSLYCGKCQNGKKFQSQAVTLTLIELVRAIKNILKYVQVQVN